MELSLKQKTFFQFYSSFLKCSLILEHFQKKTEPPKLMNFGNYGILKTWLDQCLKSPIS